MRSTSSSRARALDGDQGAEGRVAVLADAGVERRQGARVRAQQVDLFEVRPGLLGDLVERRLLAELDRQLTLDALDLAGALGDVGGQADRAAGVVEAALKRLADPDRRVRGEAEALAPVELLGGADEAEHALLDEVVHRQALALVLAGHVRRRGAGCELISRSLAARSPRSMRWASSISSCGLEQAEAARLAQELLERLEQDLVRFE